jgi:hypothetical protein
VTTPINPGQRPVGYMSMDVIEDPYTAADLLLDRTR